MWVDVGFFLVFIPLYYASLVTHKIVHMELLFSCSCLQFYMFSKSIIHLIHVYCSTFSYFFVQNVTNLEACVICCREKRSPKCVHLIAILMIGATNSPIITNKIGKS